MKNPNNVTRDGNLSQWFTPQPVIDLVGSLIDEYKYAFKIEQLHIHDPTCGNGAVLRELATRLNALVSGCEIDERVLEGVDYGNLGIFNKAWEPGDQGSANMIFLNPPYERGQDREWLVRMMELKLPIVMVHRLDFLASKKMRDAARKACYKLSETMIVGRPKFDGPKAGSPMSNFAVSLFEIGAQWEPTRMRTCLV